MGWPYAPTPAPVPGAFTLPSYDSSSMGGSLPSALTAGTGLGALTPNSFNFGSLSGAVTDPSMSFIDPSFGADNNARIGGIDAGGAPNVGGGFFGGMTGMQKVGAGITGLQTLGGLWMGLKQLSLAKKQFQFSRDFANTNLANSMKTYNTALADRARARGFTEGDSTGAVQDYVNQNSLSKAGGPAASNQVMALPSAQPGNTPSVTNPVSNNTTRNPNGY